MALAPRIISELQQIVGPANVLTSPEDLITYSFDGTAALQQLPACVAFVRNAQEVASVLQLAQREKAPVVTRGSGTGLSGGRLPVTDGIISSPGEMNRLE